MSYDIKKSVRQAEGLPVKLNVKEMSKRATAWLERRGLATKWNRRKAK